MRCWRHAGTCRCATGRFRWVVRGGNPCVHDVKSGCGYRKYLRYRRYRSTIDAEPSVRHPVRHQGRRRRLRLRGGDPQRLRLRADVLAGVRARRRRARPVHAVRHHRRRGAAPPPCRKGCGMSAVVAPSAGRTTPPLPCPPPAGATGGAGTAVDRLRTLVGHPLRRGLTPQEAPRLRRAVPDRERHARPRGHLPGRYGRRRPPRPRGPQLRHPGVLGPHAAHRAGVPPRLHLHRRPPAPGRGPGTGVEPDEELAVTHPYDPAYLPVNRLQDGTVHDW